MATGTSLRYEVVSKCQDDGWHHDPREAAERQRSEHRSRTRCRRPTCGAGRSVTERWTQERRREHTRNLLLDAAEEVFTAKGFEGASLDEIAETAGYTRGAIYKHFADKAELFLEMNSRFNEQIFTGFQDV